MNGRKSRVISFSASPQYYNRIQRIKRTLGIRSNSELIRRAIDELAVKYNVPIELDRLGDFVRADLLVEGGKA